MSRIIIVHPEGNLTNNPNLLGIVDILCEKGYEVDIYSRKRTELAQEAPYPSARFFATDIYDPSETAVLFPPGAELPPEAVSSVRRSFEECALVIGVDRGIIEARILAKSCQAPLGMISYELLFREEAGEEYLRRDREASQEVSFAVCQDRVRSFHLSRENAIPLERIIDIPVAGRKAKQGGRSFLLHDKLNIPRSMKLALYIGGVTCKWAGIEELIASSDLWPDDWALVLHQRYSRYSEEFIGRIAAKKKRNVFLSPFPSLPFEELDVLLNCADLGISFYIPQFQGNELTDRNNLRYIGMASGKIGTYLQHGLPILVNEIGEMSEHVRKYGLGHVIENPADVGPLLERIDRPELDIFRTNAWAFFQSHLDLDRTIGPLLEAISELAPLNAGSKTAACSSAPENIVLEAGVTYELRPDHEEIVVSAIISTYNSERFIRGCIEDLERQTISERIEIIVVDSGSREREGSIVRELQQVYGNIRYIRTEATETVYAAWNRGIAAARGRYITNANTDDRHRRDAFEVMSAVLDNDPSVDLVYADVLITQTGNETFERNTATGRYNWFPWDRNILLDRGCFIGPQPMWRRSLHDIYGFFDPACVTSGDYEFWLRISQTSKFHYIEEPLGLYLQHPGSIEHRNEDKKFAENGEILARYRNAATEGRLVRFLPFEQLQRIAETGPASGAGTHIAETIALIDGVVNAVASPDLDVVATYRSRREAVLGSGDGLSPVVVQSVVAAAEKAIHSNMEWARRRQPPQSPDAAVRSHVAAKALAHARRLFQRGETDAAVSTIITRGIAADLLSPAPYLELADILIAANRYEDALEVIPEMPADTEPGVILELKAVCHAALGNDQAAEDAARLALADGGTRPRALIVLGTLAARRGDLAEAEGLFRRSGSGEGLVSLGMLFWSRGDTDGAFDSLCQAVDSMALRDDAVTILADMARRLHRLHHAAQVMGNACRSNPDHKTLHREHVRVIDELGDSRQTLEAARSFVLAFGPDDEVLETGVEALRKIGPHGLPPNGGPPLVSLCMIVKNEEKQLARCLASVLPVVHEAVVVDTGSTDRTIQVATLFGARVSSLPWNGDFSEARNFAIAEARGEWILSLDADEAIAAKDHEIIGQQAHRDRGKAIAYQVVTRNYTEQATSQGWVPNDGRYPAEETAGGWYPSRKVRLFPKDNRVRFSGKVHEMVEESLREGGFEIRPANFAVHHYGELDQAKVREKKDRYYRMGKEKLAETPDDLTAMTELAVQAGELGHLEEALELWDRVLAVAPDHPEALFNRGGIHLLLGHFQDSANDSARALDLNPDSKEAACNLATAQLYLGRLEEAAGVADSVSRNHPLYPPVLALSMITAVLQGDKDRASWCCRRLREQNYRAAGVLPERIDILETAGLAQWAERLREWLKEHGDDR